jgi:hypothetical protein
MEKICRKFPKKLRFDSSSRETEKEIGIRGGREGRKSKVARNCSWG